MARVLLDERAADRAAVGCLGRHGGGEGDGHRLWLLLRVRLLSLRVAALKANQIRALIQLCVRRGARAVLSLATACFE